MVVVAINGNAQATSTPSREEMYRRMLHFKRMVKGGLIEPHWMADGRSFWYVDDSGDMPRIMKADPAANAVTPFFDDARLIKALTVALGYTPPPIRAFDLVDNEKAARFIMGGRALRMDLDSYKVLPTPMPVERGRIVRGGPFEGLGPAEVPSPTGEWTAVFKDYNLWLRSHADGRSFQLTTGGTALDSWQLQPLQCGCPSWSPNGRLLWVSKVNVHGVHSVPIVHWLKKNHEEISYLTYPQTGGAYEKRDLYVIDIGTGEAVRIDTAPSVDELIWPIAWTPDSSEILFFRYDRYLKHLQLLAASALTGRSRVLVIEQRDTFVNFMSYFRFLTLFPDGSHFVWRSERDGWYNLYLYDMKGNLPQQLTHGESPVQSVEAIDQKGGWVYYRAAGDKERPYDLQLYKVDFGGKHPVRLTEATGVHTAEIAPGFEYFLDTHSTSDRPPTVELRKTDGTKVRVLAKADISQLEALGWKKPEEFRVKAADGKTDLYGVLYKPYDFDPQKRYPVVELEYMGNNAQAGQHYFVGEEDEISFNAGALGDDAESLTQLGFIVFVVDGRGTQGRGRAFLEFTYRHMGQIEVPDHAAALKQLASARPYMDTSRVGISGFSWGGYYALRAVLQAPDVYHVAVAFAPVADLTSMAPVVEQFMGPLSENAADYDKGSNLALVHQFKGKLLIGVGTSDVIIWEHMMLMADAFIGEGKLFDFLPIPEVTHGITPRATTYMREARNAYFKQWLKP